MRLVAYTDGACSGNPGPGGYGAILISGSRRKEISQGYIRTTNQRMEIHAVLDALQTYAKVADDHGGPLPIEIVSDSTYVVNCFRDRWWVKWERNGWKNSKKEPVANTDLWKPLIELVRSGDVSFQWVKGHSGDPMNDLVDRLAVELARKAPSVVRATKRQVMQALDAVSSTAGCSVTHVTMWSPRPCENRATPASARMPPPTIAPTPRVVAPTSPI